MFFFFLACFELFGGRLFAGVVHVHLVSYGRFRLNVQLLNERDGQTPAWWCSVNLGESEMLTWCMAADLKSWNNTRSHWETSRPPVSIIVSWWYQKMMPHFEQYSECRKTLMWLCSLVLGWLIVLGCIFSVTLKPSEAGSLRLLRRFHRITLNQTLEQICGKSGEVHHLIFIFAFFSSSAA